MEAFKPIPPTEIRKSVKLFEFLARNNRYAAFPHLFTVLKVCMTIPVIVASRKGVFLSSN